MWYWVGVYALVIIAVFLPFVLLYMIAGVLWLGVMATRFMVRNVKNAWAVRTHFFSRQHWSMIRR